MAETTSRNTGLNTREMEKGEAQSKQRKTERRLDLPGSI
jgi:hypothetical protein